MRSARSGKHTRTGRAALAALLLLGVATPALAVTVSIDATKNVHPINPLIYGVAFASKADLAALNAPANRSGGNAASLYSWRANATNLANDWYYESYPQEGGDHPGASADAFIAKTKQAGAAPMITVPLVGWVAKLGAGRAILPSFSVSKYGAQCGTDYWFPDAGNGLKSDCSTPITGNDPTDANVPDTPADEQKWVKHLIKKWGNAASGGVGYYLMDNEASIWFSTHRDVHPVGPHAVEYRDKVTAMSAAIKAVDPDAKVMAPEEWGWSGFLYSGYDQQYAPTHGWTFPEHGSVQGGLDYVPWLLKEWKKVGHPVDVVSLHYYPQSGEFGNNTSDAMQLRRNRSTRELWDPSYTSESWIGTQVNLIPRLKQWVSTYYDAGTPVAITEYNWGAESHINGATTQADIYGIFGREGLDMAARWTTPDSKSVTFKAMQMYRNYDGANAGFGDTSISATGPNPDHQSAFAALRASDGAMTVMVINKDLTGTSPVTLSLVHFTGAGPVKVYRLTSTNKIKHLPNLTLSGNTLNDTAPAQSITLYVIPKA